MNRDLDTVERYERQLGAHIHFDVPRGAFGEDGPRADPRTKDIYAISLTSGTPAQRSESFWSTMHELGHVASKHTGGTFLDYFIGNPRKSEQEAEAWVWAIEHAGRPLDAAGRTSIALSLASYLATQGTTQADVGPNLRTIFALVGPDVDLTLAAELFPALAEQGIFTQATWIWRTFAETDVKLAA